MVTGLIGEPATGTARRDWTKLSYQYKANSLPKERFLTFELYIPKIFALSSENQAIEFEIEKTLALNEILESMDLLDDEYY